MVKNLSVGLILFSLSTLLICTTTTVSRFNSIEFQKENNSLVDIKLFSARIEPVQSGFKKNLLLLSDHGQAEFIRILDTRFKDNEKFANELKSECFGEDGELKADYINKDLKMVFSISKFAPDYSAIGTENNIYTPADRIEYLKFILCLDTNSHVKFTKWNKYTTEYDTLNIAEMTFTKSSATQESVGTGKESPAALGMGISYTQSMSEKQNLHQRYILLNGTIDETSLEIREEGVRDIDLAGNVIADVSVRFQETPIRVAAFSNLRDTLEVYNRPDLLKLRFDIVNIPTFDDTLLDTIRGCLSIEYLYRHVNSGYKTFYEWDDNVGYFHGIKYKNGVPLFTKSDYLPKFYWIGFVSEEKNSNKTKITVRDKQTEQFYPLVFKNYIEAREFWKWLINFQSDQKMEKLDSVVIKKSYTLYKKTACSKDSLLTKEDINNSKMGVYPLYMLTKIEK